MRTSDLRADIVDRLFGGCFANLRVGARAQSFREVHPELQAMIRGRCGKRLRVGVGDDKVDPAKTPRDHIVDGVTASSADTDNSDLWLQVSELGKLQLDAHRIPLVPERRFVEPFGMSPSL